MVPVRGKVDESSSVLYEQLICSGEGVLTRQLQIGASQANLKKRPQSACSNVHYLHNPLRITL